MIDSRRPYPQPGQPEEVEHDFYDLLDGLVQRTPWKGEEEARRYRELVAKLRAINLFGYMALATKVELTERR